MIFELDDFGCNHIISDQCQSHDCRDKLDELHYLNPEFKVTLFAIPFEMTQELLDWCDANKSWVELAVHGFRHTTNYECENITIDEFTDNMDRIDRMVKRYFVKGFRAPGWQISDDCFSWLKDNGWWVADQDYNTKRRPRELKAWVNRDGVFYAHKGDDNDWVQHDAWHGHTWDVGWNGIYESFPAIQELVRNAKEFKFVSEVL